MYIIIIIIIIIYNKYIHIHCYLPAKKPEKPFQDSSGFSGFWPKTGIS